MKPTTNYANLSKTSRPLNIPVAGIVATVCIIALITLIA